MMNPISFKEFTATVSCFSRASAVQPASAVSATIHRVPSGRPVIITDWPPHKVIEPPVIMSPSLPPASSVYSKLPSKGLPSFSRVTVKENFFARSALVRLSPVTLLVICRLPLPVGWH